MRGPLVASACAVRADEERLAFTVLMTALVLDPLACWLWADTPAYIEAFPDFAHALGGRALELGTADGIDPMLGAALWLPPGVESDRAGLERVIDATVSVGRRDEVRELLERWPRLRPSRDHWQLASIGVLPGFQGRGLGSALLRRGLERCDRERRRAHVVATSPNNRRLFEHHGFVVVSELRVGGSPPLWSMERDLG